jgi:hypothetical protein
MSEKHEMYSYDETDELGQLKRWREMNDDYETEVIGVYHVEGVGYCTGLAWAEEQAASFGAPSPVFVHWETVNGEDEDDVTVLTMPDDEVKSRVVNVVQVGEKVLVTIRHPHGDSIYEGSMQDVMLE